MNENKNNNRRRDFRRKKKSNDTSISQNVDTIPSIFESDIEQHLCPKCKEPIQDITTAIADKETGEPMHFDCVVSFLTAAESLKQNEKIAYIGQGRFAVVYFENPNDTKNFSIVRVIEWEQKESNHEWRSSISDRYVKSTALQI